MKSKSTFVKPRTLIFRTFLFQFLFLLFILHTEQTFGCTYTHTCLNICTKNWTVGLNVNQSSYFPHLLASNDVCGGIMPACVLKHPLWFSERQKNNLTCISHLSINYVSIPLDSYHLHFTLEVYTCHLQSGLLCTFALSTSVSMWCDFILISFFC